MSVLFYRRPTFIERHDGPLNPSDCQKYIERTKGRKDAIPAELAFDTIMQGKTLPVSPLCAAWACRTSLTHHDSHAP